MVELTPEIIEKLARHMFEIICKEGGVKGPQDWDQLSPSRKEICRTQARAPLGPLREALNSDYERFIDALSEAQRE